MAAPEDLAKLTACAGGGTSEARRALRFDTGAARGGRGLPPARVVLGEAPARFGELCRAGRFLGGALDGSGPRRTPCADAGVRPGDYPRRGRRRPGPGILSGPSSVPQVRAGQGLRRPHRATPPFAGDALALPASHGARAGARGGGRGVAASADRSPRHGRRRALYGDPDRDPGPGRIRGDRARDRVPPGARTAGRALRAGRRTARGTVRACASAAPARGALAGARARLRRTRVARLALCSRRGPLLARRHGGADDDAGEDRTVPDLPSGIPHHDRGDLAPHRPRAARGLPRSRPRPPPAPGPRPLRPSEQAVGLGVRRRGCPLLRAPRRHLLLLQRRHVPKPRDLAVPNGPGPGGPRGALRLSPLRTRRPPPRPPRLLRRPLPPGGEHVPRGDTGAGGPLLRAVPLPARQAKERCAVPLARLARPPLGALRLGHL